MEHRFDVSKRTIYRDLKDLESAGVPIIYDREFGYSLMEGYRIHSSNLTQEELLSLIVAEKIMQQHETDFIKKHFESLIVKIRGSFHSYQKNFIQNFEDKLYVDKDQKNQNYIPNIINLILEATIKKVISEIHYIKSDEIKTVVRKVEPIGLYYEDAFWYVLCFCHLRKEYRNFRLDRINKISLTEEVFIKEHLPMDVLRKKTNLASFNQIIIEVDRELSHYLYWERNNYGFIKEEIQENKVVMYFEFSGHPTSFVRWFIKFADFGEIIEPIKLESELTKILTKSIDRHLKN